MQNLNYTYQGLKLDYYLSKPGKKTILILHGWGSSIQSYPKLIQLLTDVNFQTILLEFPGHGGSDKLNTNWEVADFNKLVLDFIQHMKSKHKLTLDAIYAHSNGARVLFNVLPDLPSKVDIFIAAGAGVPYRKNILQKTVEFLSPLKGILKFIPFFKFFRSLVLRLIGAHDYLKLDESMQQTFHNLVSYDCRPILSSIPQEVHLLWGDNDLQTPVYMAHTLDQEIPKSKLTILPNTTHGIHKMHPDFVVKYINQHTS